MRVLRYRKWIWVGGLCLGMLAGCGSPAQPDPGAVQPSQLYQQPATPATPVAPATPQPSGTPGGTATTTADPMAQYVLSPAEQAVIRQAMFILITRCMHQKGYQDYTPRPAILNPRQNTSVVFSKAWGLVDANHARLHGYQPEEQNIDPSMIVDPNDPAVRDEFTCSQQQNPVLGPSPASSDLESYNQMMADSLAAAQADQGVGQAVTSWSRCMADKGYSYSDPLQPASAPWPAEVTEAEKATAVADVACKDQVSLLSTWDEARYRALRQAIPGHLPELQRMYEGQLHQLSVAQGIVAEGI